MWIYNPLKQICFDKHSCCKLKTFLKQQKKSYFYSNNKILSYVELHFTNLKKRIANPFLLASSRYATLTSRTAFDNRVKD